MSVELANVSHSYGSRHVLIDVGLRLEAGSVVAIVGPSGSGKTTLLSILGLLIEPERGTVRIDGQDLTRDRVRRQQVRASGIAWVFQTANVIPYRTALDNVSMGALKTGLSRFEAESEARRALSRVGLGDHLDAPARTLSGGQLQRVCIARAVAGAPTLMLADEPTGQLDRSTSASVARVLMEGIAGATTVIATHDLELAGMCPLVLRLVDGGLVEAQP